MLRSRFGPYFSSITRFLLCSPCSLRKPEMYPSRLRISAMWDLSFECGITTSSWYAELALRRRVSMSAIGSVIVMVTSSTFLAVVPADRASRACGEVESQRAERACGADRPALLAPAGRSPARLAHAGQFASVCHFAQADTAQAELAVHGMRTATALASVVAPHLELRLGSGLDDQRLLRHSQFSLLRSTATTVLVTAP